MVRAFDAITSVISALFLMLLPALLVGVVVWFVLSLTGFIRTRKNTDGKRKTWLIQLIISSVLMIFPVAVLIFLIGIFSGAIPLM